MKKLSARVLSFLMVLAILASVLACMSAVSAAPKYNNGKFGVVCKALSAQAKAYYTGSYTYEKLSAQFGSTLKSSISALVTKDRHTGNYNSLKTNFAYTDAVNGSSSKLRLFYCGVTSSSEWVGDTNFNREHMWPDSKGGSAAEGDLHSMRPTDKGLNSARSNYPYGEVTNGTPKYSDSNHGSVLGGYLGGGFFEPLDNVKGDVARAILYDYCTYSSLSNLSLVFQSTDVMLDWIKLDPVDEFEMTRNDVVEGIQDCRNPFVDYPELAYNLFNKEVPADLITPSHPNAVTYQVTAVSENTDYGTVSKSGMTITATPNTGYTVSGYKLSPEDAATVTQSGNVFTVSNVKADCTVTITFAPKTAATITYVVPSGVTVSGTTASYVGDTVKLATVSGTPADTEGYTFFGWSEKQIADTTTVPSVQKAGASYTVKAAQTTFYGVFSYLDGTTAHYLTNLCKHEKTHEETIQPTCTKNGAVNTVCDDCGAILATSPIAKTGHDYEDTVIAPTCENKGYTLHTCKNCGDSYKNTYVAALGHDYVSQVTKPATDTENGVMTFTCSRCDSSYTEVIPATGSDVHDCPCDDYTDLDHTAWYHEGVDLMLEMGYMNGIGNGRFDPEGTTTRAMVVTVLWRIAGEPAPKAENTFTDVIANGWYTDAVVWAAENGVVKGVGDGKFEPEGRITRAQMATILFRYVQSLGKDTSKRADLRGFSDGSKTDAWATDAMQWAVAEGIINGSDGMLLPQGNATRVQVATILYRSMDWITE